MLLRASLAVVLLLAGCGGGEEAEQAEGRTEPSAACDEAFASAVPDEEPTIPSTEEEGDEGEGPETPTGGEDLDTVSLERLQPTLHECEDVEDWLAGARAHRGAIPNELDGVAALRFACDAMEVDSTPCQQVAVPDDIDDAGPDEVGSPEPSP